MEPIYLVPVDICFDAQMKACSEQYYKYFSESKGSDSAVSLVPFSTFKVASFKAGSSISYFKTETVARQESGTCQGFFVSGDIHPWPKREALDFFAWNGEGTGEISNNDGIVSLSYTAPESEKGLLFVGMEKNCASSRLCTVEDKSQMIEFEEALTMVKTVTLESISMSPGTETFMYIVKDLKIKDINCDGAFTFNPASHENNWSLGGNPMDHVFAGSGTPEIIFTGVCTKEICEYPFTMIPQDVVFYIVFDVYRSVDGGTTWSKNAENVSGSATVSLACGESYDISITFGASPQYGTTFSIKTQSTGS